MTIKELKEKIKNLPDTMDVCVRVIDKKIHYINGSKIYFKDLMCIKNKYNKAECKNTLIISDK